jgi:hypothetical protein
MVAIAENPKDEVAISEEDRLVSFNLRCIPFKLRRMFKRWCAENDVTMEQTLVSVMEDIVTGDIRPNVS